MVLWLAAVISHARSASKSRVDLEHELGTQRGVDDARILDHRAFDVKKPVEYPVHQVLCGCLFILVGNILPAKRSSLTPTTAQERTHTHKDSNSANSIVPFL